MALAALLTSTPAAAQGHFVRGELPVSAAPHDGREDAAPARPANPPANPTPRQAEAVPPVPVAAPAVVDIPADAIAITPQDSAAAIVAATPAGSTFVFTSGVHRAVEINVRTGDTYLGEPGAVLDAAVPLNTTRYAEAGNGLRQYQGVESDAATAITGPSCAPWFEGGMAICGHEQEVFRSEMLFADGQRLRHVNAPEDVAPGSFHYNGETDALTTAGDYTELAFATADFAFAGWGAEDVTIAGITLRNYATPAQHGTIDAYGGNRWTIDGVVVAGSHGYGIRIGQNTTITNSLITDNGHIGIGGQADNTSFVATGNEISHNAWLGVQPGFEAGGMKVLFTHDAVVTHNWVHDNASKGLWFDGFNRNATIAHNRVERSGQTGILYEISFDAEIHDNVVVDNHTSGDVTESFGNIQIVNSTNVEVHTNTISGGGRHELTLVDTGEEHGLSDVTVRDNHITINTSWEAGAYGAKDSRPGGHSPAPLSGLTFADNTVVLDGPHTLVFATAEGIVDDVRWSEVSSDTIVR
ncbi:right-handed parallel beta-helix repeat-containing protein [Euzebya tangerina]|uniref:right-handed parallel beta-helix repeat-containing protein n=1 Tax=Euzebya tangerina TaxID=591198 RepID=UPI0013C32D11|nr:right-handed parallel beta-helix repeat-containing protein [Euzebya tangerina]